MGLCVLSLFCDEILSVLSSFVIISLRKRGRACCFLAVMWQIVFCVSSSQWAGLQCVIVTFPGHHTYIFINCGCLL